MNVRTFLTLTGSSLFFAAALVAADTPPTCRLAPDLAEIIARCSDEQADSAPAACAQLRALELVANGEDAEAQATLVRELDLPESAAARLMPLLHMLSMMVIADEPMECFERQFQGILQMFSRPESFQSLMSYEALVYFNQIVAFFPEDLVAKVEELLDAETGRKLSGAGRALADLLESTSAGEQLTEAIENNPILLMMSPEWLTGRLGAGGPLPEGSPSTAGDDMQTIHDVLVLVSAGRLPEAREALARARRQAVGDPVREGKLALNAGAGFALLGQIEDAASLLQQADELLASVPDDEEAQRVRSLGSWFRIMALEEIGLSEHSASVATEAQSRDDVFARIMGGVKPAFGGSFSESPDFQQLADTFQALSKLFFAPDRDLEDLKTTMGAVEKAFPWLTESMDIGSSAAPRPYFGILMEVFAHAVEGRPEGSLRAAEELLEQYPRYHNAWVLALVTVQYWQAGEPQKALDVCRRAIEVLESEAAEFRVDETLTTFFGGRGYALYQLAVELAGRLGRHAEAFDYAERGRAWTLRRLLGSPRPANGSNGLETNPEAQKLLTTLADVERELRAVSPKAERERLTGEIDRLRRDFETLRLRAKLSIPEQSGLAQAEPVALELAQREVLKEEDALVAFFPGLGDNRDSAWPLWIWVVERDGVSAVALPMSRERYREAACQMHALRWHAASRRARRSAATRGVQLLSGCDAQGEDPAIALYRRFLGPVSDRLRGKRHLTIVPYGPLHYLPFAALRDPESKRYLIEDFTLSLAPSVSALDRLAGRSTNLGHDLLVLGDPETELEDLAGARREAEAVARFLDTRPLLGHQATEEEVHARSSGLRLLHLAAHGEYVRGHPIFSRVVLGAGAGHDGALTVHEIWDRLDLRGTQLVALSGCETALGDLTAGDEVIGLTQSFLVAGSRAVLSTLWPVDDKASKRLAVAFYEHFLAGVPAAEALRSAQLELLRSRNHGTTYFWAGYTLTGNPNVRWQSPALSE